MKKTFVLNLVLVVLTMFFTACDGNNPDLSGDNTSATADFFPEPCLDWGISESSLKSKMLSIGYSFDEAKGNYLEFIYNNMYVQCSFDSKCGYVYAECGDFSRFAVNTIISNYQKQCTDYGSGYDENGDLYHVLITKDNKTMIVGVTGEYDIIYYVSTSYADLVDNILDIVGK